MNNPIILKYGENLSEEDALNLEMSLIKTIGRTINNGPLTNLTNGNAFKNNVRNSPIWAKKLPSMQINVEPKETLTETAIQVKSIIDKIWPKKLLTEIADLIEDKELFKKDTPKEIAEVDNLIIIGEEIRRKRKLLKITQIDVAEISGVSLRSIKSIEKGSINFTIKSLFSILNTLGMSVTITE
jgi:DNA-binding XRE family transcriptional regulator